MDHWLAEDTKLSPNIGDGGSSERNVVRGNMNSIRLCLGVVRDEREFVQSAAFKVPFHPLMLVSGEWGTGKTHLLCDVTQMRIARGHTLAPLAFEKKSASAPSRWCWL
jgi:hypothetical protein